MVVFPIDSLHSVGGKQSQRNISITNIKLSHSKAKLKLIQGLEKCMFVWLRGRSLYIQACVNKVNVKVPLAHVC